MTDNIRPALYQASYTVDIANNLDGEKEMVDVVGPCCESGDIVCKDVMLTKAFENDVLITCVNMNSRLTPSVAYFLKFPPSIISSPG